MKRFAPLWILLLLGALSLGCEDALICPGFECDIVEPQCFASCEEICDGFVIDAVCDEVDLICLCECEFACFEP